MNPSFLITHYLKSVNFHIVLRVSLDINLCDNDVGFKDMSIIDEVIIHLLGALLAGFKLLGWCNYAFALCSSKAQFL